MKKYKYFFLANLFFVFIALNAWDFFIDKTIFNAMSLGLFMFAPVILLWFWGNFKAVVVITLISIFQFVVMLVFLAEGLQLSGINSSLKSVFWLPYLGMAGLNLYWGLSIYTKHKEKLGIS